MLHTIKDLYGSHLLASDGEIGKIKDFYFDDQRWVVRYLIVDTGTWLTGRPVLISPHAFGKFDREKHQLHVNLTKARIEKAPSIDQHLPVSRQFEQEYYTYYGWPTYWTGDLMWGAAGYPLLEAPIPERAIRNAHQAPNDLHLRSTQALKGYDIEATDGSIGSVASFMVDDRTWAVRDLIVETGHWYSGREILISPGKVTRISYPESKVYVNLTKADIERTKEDHLAVAAK
jgi:sporulation protein YlmC with PRC-barrel domain